MTDISSRDLEWGKLHTAGRVFFAVCGQTNGFSQFKIDSIRLSMVQHCGSFSIGPRRAKNTLLVLTFPTIVKILIWPPDKAASCVTPSVSPGSDESITGLVLLYC